MITVSSIAEGTTPVAIAPLMRIAQPIRRDPTATIMAIACLAQITPIAQTMKDPYVCPTHVLSATPMMTVKVTRHIAAGGIAAKVAPKMRIVQPRHLFATDSMVVLNAATTMIATTARFALLMSASQRQQSVVATPTAPTRSWRSAIEIEGCVWNVRTGCIAKTISGPWAIIAMTKTGVASRA